jgi:ankyrin repeat protein
LRIVGAAVNVNGRYNRAALHKAAKGRNLDIVKVFLTARAKVDAKDYTGSMPFHETAKNYDGSRKPLREKKDRLGIAKEFLASGANPNAKNKSGQMPLNVSKNKEVKAVLRKAQEKQKKINGRTNRFA